MVDFNVPPFVSQSLEYMLDAAAKNRKICGDGPYSKKCHQWLESRLKTPKALLTTSGTAALEMAAILCELKPGDEVILPSFTFSSTATAFQMVGATLVFVDVRPDTMNIDENKIEEAITNKTRVIVPVHYAGVACDMDKIMQVADDHSLFVVEDAAQAIMSTYKGRPLGTFGHFGCLSFHETKNFSMGEGGAILINKETYIERAEIVREKGTNRQRFFRGQVDKYTWVDRGGSYLQSDLNAAYLYAQLEQADAINNDRLNTWDFYYNSLSSLQNDGRIELPTIPAGCIHNAHMFYIKCGNLSERTALIQHLKEQGVSAVFHYIPLHSSPAGEKFGRLYGKDVFTTKESERLLRLPMYFGMTNEDKQRVVDAVRGFYG